MSEFVLLAKMFNSAEAEIIRVALEDAGIDSWVESDHAAATLSHVGSAIGGARLLVKSDDLDTAWGILNRIEQENQGFADEVSSPKNCPHCGETVELSFVVCWSCGKSVNEPPVSGESGSVEETITRNGVVVDSQDESANLCPLCGKEVGVKDAVCLDCQRAEQEANEAEDARREQADQHLRRGWRSAWLSLVLFPGLLNIYSISQLHKYRQLQVVSGDPLSSRFTIAQAVNVIIIVAVSLLVIPILQFL